MCNIVDTKVCHWTQSLDSFIQLPSSYPNIHHRFTYVPEHLSSTRSLYVKLHVRLYTRISTSAKVIVLHIFIISDSRKICNNS